PLLQRVIPIVDYTLTLRIDRRGSGDFLLLARETVRAQLQTPLPAAVLGLNQKASTVEARNPLLARVTGMIAVLQGHDLVAAGLVGGTDTGPIRRAEPLRDLVRPLQVLRADLSGSGGEGAQRREGAVSLSEAACGQDQAHRQHAEVSLRG